MKILCTPDRRRLHNSKCLPSKKNFSPTQWRNVQYVHLFICYTYYVQPDSSRTVYQLNHPQLKVKWRPLRTGQPYSLSRWISCFDIHEPTGRKLGQCWSATVFIVEVRIDNKVIVGQNVSKVVGEKEISKLQQLSQLASQIELSNARTKTTPRLVAERLRGLFITEYLLKYVSKQIKRIQIKCRQTYRL